MRATLFGHACWLIEAGGEAILTDPVLQDPFEEGTVTSCPAREVRSLPPITAIYLSHRHLDHFHAPSLQRLDSRLPVLCPEDPLLQAALRRLGFADLRPLRAFEPLALGGLSVLPVPSVSDTFLEFGAVFSAADASLFDQVDTPLTGATVRRLRELAPRLDAHLAMYACQEFTWFEGRKQDLAELHATNLSAAIQVGARLVVPGSAGFRFAGPLGWLNPLLFPISEARFLADLARLSPGQRALSLDPGDVLALPEGGVARQASPFVRMSEDDRRLLAFDPLAPVPPLQDDNLSGYPEEFLERFAAAFLGEALPALIRQALQAGDAAVEPYRQHRLTYQVEVVFPGGRERRWAYPFAAPGADTVPGGVLEPDVRKRIAASALADLCGGRRGVFWARTRSRRHAAAWSLQAVPGGLAVDDLAVRDLLAHLVILAKIAQKGELQGQLEYYGLLSEVAGAP